MNVTLTGQSKKFEFELCKWEKPIRIASSYGWKPRGTQQVGRLLFPYEDVNEPDPPWFAGYIPSEYKFVTWDDAINLADALKKYQTREGMDDDTIKDIIAISREGGFFITSS